MKVKWMHVIVPVVAVLLILGIAGCGKKRPVNLGEADITALGLGVGRELQSDLVQGDTLLVFGIPNARAHAEESERAIVRGLENQLRGLGVRVQRVRYTDEEFEAYMRGRHDSLHESFAASAFQRYAGDSPRAIMSLVGWPEDGQTFLPSNATFIGISWTWGENPQHWLDMFDRVIAVNSLHGPITGRPSRSALRREDEVLEWFDERFEVLKGGA